MTLGRGRQTPRIADATTLLAGINRKNDLIVEEVKGSEVYRAITDTDATVEQVKAIMRNILYETASYGPHITQATFAAIGRLNDQHEFIPGLMQFVLEEVSHPNLAMNGYLHLAGSAPIASERKMSPPSFAVAAVCHAIADNSHPFAFLGYLLLLEGTTAALAPSFYSAMVAKGLGEHFLEVHSSEDEGHTEYLEKQVTLIIAAHPSAAEAIDNAYDCFATVYPLGVWSHALTCARQELLPHE